jgi:hypothetical protein
MRAEALLLCNHEIPCTSVALKHHALALTYLTAAHGKALQVRRGTPHPLGGKTTMHALSRVSRKAWEGSILCIPSHKVYEIMRLNETIQFSVAARKCKPHLNPLCSKLQIRQ